MQIEGVSAVITGGASGLGGATAQLLSELGARVTIFDLAEAAGIAHATAIGARFTKVDVTDEMAVSDALALAEAAHGVPRILINCAGIALAARTVSRDGRAHPLAIFRRVVDINLVGTFNVSSRFAARLAQADRTCEERGVIVNTASVAGFEGQVGQAAYAASKAGIIGMTLPIARDLAAIGIRVITIAPGIFATPMVAEFPQSVQDSLGAQVPFPSRLGQPIEFAQLVESILRIPMLNGETIRLDGAIRMGP